MKSPGSQVLLDRATLLVMAVACLAAMAVIVVWGWGHAETLPTVNASLNAAAGVLLVVGWALIKGRRERAHARVMLAAFVTSIAFLTSYVVYHLQVHHREFSGPSSIRPIYLTILISHVLLAATVPFLAGRTIWLAVADRRPAHRRLAWWTLPIWLYVSVTGVLIYAMLYHLYPAAG